MIKTQYTAVKLFTELAEENQMLKKGNSLREQFTLHKHTVDDLTQRINAYCIDKRAKHVEHLLKIRFQEEMSDLEATFQEQSDPDNFDPSLATQASCYPMPPVFVCSAKAFLEITSHLTNESYTQTVARKAATGIPAIQQWTRKATLPWHKNATYLYTSKAASFTESLINHIQHTTQATEDDKKEFKNLWCHVKEKPQICTTLIEKFHETTLNMALEVEAILRHELEDCIFQGVEEAKLSALQVVDDFHNTRMNHQTHKAVLRRHGCFKDWNLSHDFLTPLISKIINSWTAAFDRDFFGPFQQNILEDVTEFLGKFQQLASFSLQESCKAQVLIAEKQVKSGLDELIDSLKAIFHIQRKILSRKLIPYVVATLRNGYNAAIVFTGPGCVKKRKEAFRTFVEAHKDEMFQRGARNITTSLTTTLERIQNKADNHLMRLAQRIEITLSAVWESAPQGSVYVRVLKAVQASSKKLNEMEKSIVGWKSA